MQPFRLLVVNNDTLERSCIARLCETGITLHVISQISSLKEVESTIKNNAFDLALVNVGTEIQTGFIFVEHLLNTRSCSVLLFDLYPAHWLAVPLLKIGITGYLAQPTSAELIQAAHQVALGHSYVSAHITQQWESIHQSPFCRLSWRELQVTLLIICGTHAKNIATLLQINPKTVNSYRYRIFNKLRINNNIQLAQRATEAGLFPYMQGRD